MVLGLVGDVVDVVVAHPYGIGVELPGAGLESAGGAGQPVEAVVGEALQDRAAELAVAGELDGVADAENVAERVVGVAQVLELRGAAALGAGDKYVQGLFGRLAVLALWQRQCFTGGVVARTDVGAALQVAQAAALFIIAVERLDPVTERM